ncbi:T cell receptor gamma variable 4 isoform X2 [Canis lupus familiaris]|uniref:T cell receptor gamma variable 4 isoform X2 n=1 Tax=Canis lupus familiaris TaxID=9615 RepID=UPI0018F52780|nr:T cell receptor gamma variable 4 isoform X2 [Canis lupus familiaris]
MLGPLAVLCALLFPGGGAGLKLEQTPVVVGRLGTSATLLCTVDSSVYYIHWYFHKKFAAPKRLLYLDMSSSSVQRDTSVKAHKVNAKKGKDSYSCNLLVQKLEKSDEGVYYCAAWEEHSHSCCPGPCTKRFPSPRVLHGWHLPLTVGLWVVLESALSILSSGGQLLRRSTAYNPGS